MQIHRLTDATPRHSSDGSAQLNHSATSSGDDIVSSCVCVCVRVTTRGDRKTRERKENVTHDFTRRYFLLYRGSCLASRSVRCSRSFRSRGTESSTRADERLGRRGSQMMLLLESLEQRLEGIATADQRKRTALETRSRCSTMRLESSSEPVRLAPSVTWQGHEALQWQESRRTWRQASRRLDCLSCRWRRRGHAVERD